MALTKRQKEIIKAAIRIIAEEGIEHLSMKKLSQTIGISEPALYRHFNNKIDILASTIRYLKEIAEEIINKSTTGNFSTPEKIKNVMINYLKSFVNEPYLVTIVSSDEIFPNNKILIEENMKIVELNQSTFVSLIEQGKNDGSIKNDLSPEHLSIIFMGAVRVLVKKWVLAEYSFDLIKEGKTLVNTLVNLVSN